MLNVLLIWRCTLTVRLSVRSGLYFGSSAVTSDAPALPPSPGTYGCESVGETLGSGAARPSVPMRKAVLGSTPLLPRQPPVRLTPVQDTACGKPGGSSGTNNWFTPFRRPKRRP